MEKRTPVLVVDQLTKIFPSRSQKGAQFVAVDHISFTLHSGEVLGLLGPNGAGKTTTIQMLLTTLTPTSGAISMLGKNLATDRSEILQHVGFASTYISLPAHLTIEENLEVHGRLYGLTGKVLRERIEKFMASFSISSMRKQTVATLSAGQKTRVMLAKAFMTHPSIVLLDEPTAALDPDVAQEVRQFVVHQQREYGVSILLTSHNMAEVSAICDRVMVLQHGKIIADDTPDELAASVSTTKVYLVVGDGLKRAATCAQSQDLPYVIEERWITIEVDEHKVADLLTDLARAGVSYSQIWIEKPTLDDYFLHISKQSKKMRK